MLYCYTLYNIIIVVCSIVIFCITVLLYVVLLYCCMLYFLLLYVVVLYVVLLYVVVLYVVLLYVVLLYVALLYTVFLYVFCVVLCYIALWTYDNRFFLVFKILTTSIGYQNETVWKLTFDKRYRSKIFIKKCWRIISKA